VPKPQPLVAMLVDLDQVQAARVRLCDAARLREDQIEQRLDVAFGAERHADARELADLARALRCLPARPRRFRPRSRFPEAGANRDQQAAGTGRLRQEPGQKLDRESGGDVRLTVAPQRHDRAPGVDERAHDVDRERRTALGVEQEHRRPVVGHREVFRLAHGSRFHLRCLERRRDRVGTPQRGM